MTHKTEMIRVILVDDHELIRQGLKRLLDLAETIKVVAETNNGFEALDLEETLKPDLIIADINMPHMSGLDLLLKLKEKKSKTKIILLTVENNREILEKCIELGVNGYILKDSAGQEIHRAVTHVINNQVYIDPALTGLLVNAMKGGSVTNDLLAALTAREMDILKLMVQGMTNKEIAKTLFLSEKTVKNHMTSLFRKLDVKDRVNAILYAVEHHITR